MNDPDRLITEEYEQNKSEVLRTVNAKLGAAGIKSSLADLEAPYNEAWHALYMKMSAGEEIGNRIGFLVTVTYRRSISEYRASRGRLRADETELSKVGVEFDLDAQMDAEIKVRHVVEGLRAGLSEREFEAATLCHLHGYSRPEAARAIGVKPKRMEKIMDGASSRISAVIEKVRSGEHCEDFSSRVRAYAVGLLDPDGERYRLTKEHLAHCPACRREVCLMRGLAAAAPPVPALLALSAGSGAAVSATPGTPPSASGMSPGSS
ncbi:MAG: sigma-70 family RNA polymerase sigma factor, partial [Actinomycetota bacterium]|nr:sigma-70 family RNA polymerase sigma factor [Actinomycetota bacterium]